MELLGIKRNTGSLEPAFPYINPFPTPCVDDVSHPQRLVLY